MAKKKQTEAVEKINSVRVLALWKGFSPDARPYKPSTPQIEFAEPLFITVKVPLQSDLIDNAAVISSAQLTNQTEETPVFTPLGMRYIIDLFESVMQNGNAELNVPESEDDEDWGDEDTEAKPEKSKDSDDEWDDEVTESKDDEDVDFEEEWED